MTTLSHHHPKDGTQTALDEFARRVRYLWRWLGVRGYENGLDLVVREESRNQPNLFGQALNTPRYLAYCKEQTDIENKAAEMTARVMQMKMNRIAGQAAQKGPVIYGPPTSGCFHEFR